MKQIVFISALISFGLVGCGGSSSEPSTIDLLPNKVTIDEKNQIRVTSEGITQTGLVTEKVDNLINLNAEISDVKFFARANEPISVVEIYPANEQLKLPSGWINLNYKTKQANLQFLAASHDSKDFSLTCEGDGCIAKNAIYKIADNTRNSVISINFDGANIKHHNILPLKFSTSNHYYNTGDIGSSISYNMSSSNASIFGELNYSIPNQWVVMQKNRFPLINVEGQLIFDGEAYTVTELEESFSTDSPKSLVFSFINGKGQKLSLFISQVNDATSTRETGTYLTIIDGNESFQGHYPLQQKIWSDTKQQTRFNFNQLTLKSWNGTPKLLMSNLAVPYLDSLLTLNNKPLNFRFYDGKTQAFARNDQKGYNLLTTEGSTLQEYSLKFIHELKGHLSISYQTGDETYTCGNREIACAGLSVDSDQKTYRFNQVKVGNNTLNGSVFIPGVFE